MGSSNQSLIFLLAHKLLHDQGILHGDLSYGNTFLLESEEDGNIHGFLADLDLASISDKALDKLTEDTSDILKQQRGKGPRSVCEITHCHQKADDLVSGNRYFHGC